MLQGGDGDQGLEGRARRIGGGQRLVEQGLVVILGKGAVLRPAETADEAIGVEAGRRDQGQDIARPAIHQYRRTAFLAERLQAAELEVHVETELDLFPGERRNVATRCQAYLPAAGINLDLLRARAASQRQVEGLLQPLAADPEPRMQHHGLGVGAGLGDVLLVHLGHIADHVGEGAAMRIDPHLAHVGRDSGKLRGADVHRRELFPGDVLHDRHRRAARRIADVPEDTLAPGVVHGQVGRQGRDHGLGVLVLLAGVEQPEVGTVGGQDGAIPVGDHSAWWGHQPEVELVRGRQLGVAVVFDELERGEARAEGGHPQGDSAAEQEGPPVENALPGVDVGEDDRGLGHGG